jgi:uncharacterized membrane protein YbhN (UPF0104 family)
MCGPAFVGDREREPLVDQVRPMRKADGTRLENVVEAAKSMWRKAAARASELAAKIPPPVRLALKLSIAAAALIFTLSAVDWSAVRTHGWWLVVPVVLGVLITLVLLLLCGLRWSILVAFYGGRGFGTFSAYRGIMISSFFNMLIPGAVGGDLIRVHYSAKRSGLTMSKAALAVLLDRLFGLLALAIYCSVGLAINQRLLDVIGPRPPLPVLIAVMLAGLVAATVILRRYAIIPNKAIPFLILISLAAQAIDFLIIAISAWVTGVDIASADLLVIVPLLFIVSVLPISPGGHGVREATLVGLLVFFGVPLSDAALVAMLLLMVKLASALCGLGFFLTQPKSERVVPAQLD